MSIIEVVVTVFVIFILAGVLLWLVNTFIPMQPTLKDAMNRIVVGIVVICVVLWLLSLFFNIGSFGSLRTPSIR